MVQLFMDILPLALGAAISPTLLAATILMLSGEDRPVELTTIFILGTTLPLLIIGLPGVLFLKDLTREVAIRSGSKATIDLFFGVLLLSLAIRMLLRKPTYVEKESQKRPREVKSASKLKLFLGGAVVMATNFTTLALFIPATKEISEASVSLIGKYAVLLVLIVITLAVAVVPFSVYIMEPARAKRVFEPAGKYARTHNRAILIGMLFFFGLFLLAKGFRA